MAIDERTASKEGVSAALMGGSCYSLRRGILCVLLAALVTQAYATGQTSSSSSSAMSAGAATASTVAPSADSNDGSTTAGGSATGSTSANNTVDGSPYNSSATGYYGNSTASNATVPMSGSSNATVVASGADSGSFGGGSFGGSGWSATRCAPPGTADSSVTRYEKTWICLDIGGSRAVINPEADRFTAVEVPGSFAKYKAAGTATTFSVTSLSAASDDPSMTTSSYKYYTKADAGDGAVRVFPVYAVTVHVELGVPIAVTFDEGCSFCDARTDSCRVNGLPANTSVAALPEDMTSCTMGESECMPRADSAIPGANTCDLKVFVTWTGTDTKGQFFTSASKRFSRYRAWPIGVQSLWQSIKDTAISAVNRLNPTGRPQ